MTVVNEIIENLAKQVAKSIYAPVLLDLYEYLPDAKAQKKSLSIVGKIAQIMEDSQYLVSLTDARGFFVCVNSTWINEFGWSFKEFTENSFFEFIHPDDIEKSMQAMEDVSIHGDHIDKYKTFENRYRTKSGQYKTVKWRIHNEYDVKRKLFTSIAEVMD